MEVREEQPSSHRLAKSMGVDARNMQVMKASFFMEEDAPSGLGMFLNCRLRLRQKRKCGSYGPEHWSPGFLTRMRSCSNQPAQLRRLVGILKFHLLQVQIFIYFAISE